MPEHGSGSLFFTRESGKIVEIIRLDLAEREQIDLDHDLRTGDHPVSRPLHLANMALRTAEGISELCLRHSLLPSPCHELHCSPPNALSDRYCHSLYFETGHKQVTGSKYHQMQYLLRMNPSNRVRELRKKAGLSQTELANLAGISQPAISQIENDTRPLTVDWMRALARILNCTVADFLTDEDNPDRLKGTEERELVTNYRAADEAQQEMVRRVAAPIKPRHSADVTPIRVSSAA